MVDDSVVIDFPVAKWIEDAMKEIEDCDLREDYMYFTLIDALWVDLKNWMAKGKISEAQWDHIMIDIQDRYFYMSMNNIEQIKLNEYIKSIKTHDVTIINGLKVLVNIN